MNKVLVISVSGIGNTILQLPLIRNIIERPGCMVDVLVGSNTMCSLLENEEGIRNVFVLPESLRSKAVLVRALAKERYSKSIACFPSNRPEFFILPFIIGVQTRVIHSYPDSRSVFELLSNLKTDAFPGLHDVYQNLNLLKCLGLKPRQELGKPSLDLRKNLTQSAEAYLNALGIRDEALLGIHPGSGPIEGKRWPIKYFGETVRRLVQKGHFSKVLIFGGAEEMPLKKALLGLTGSGIGILVDAPFLLTAALISKCRFMLSNDSGLMHVAAAVDAPVLGIFGPTDWKRTAPFGPRAYFIRSELECAPCLSYPFTAKRARIRCRDVPECLTGISPDQVVEKIEQIIDCTLAVAGNKT